MTKEELLKLIKEKPDSYVQIIKARHKSFFKEIDSQYDGNTFGEKLYKSLYGVRKCKHCNKESKFKSFLTGYTEYCSKKCSNISTSRQRSQTLVKKNKQKRSQYYEIKLCVTCNTQFESLISRKQICCSSKCSGVYVGNNIDRIEKIKHTKQKKYGSPNYVNVDKAKQTCNEK